MIGFSKKFLLTSKVLALRVDSRLILEVGQAAREVTGERRTGDAQVVANIKMMHAAEQREERVGNLARELSITAPNRDDN